VDANTVDASTVDAGTVDAGTVDAGTVDSGVPMDSGTVDASTVDAGTHDAASDGGTTGPSACTSLPCASSGPNSVQCDSSTSGVCTATEALLVARDIGHGFLTSGGQLSPATSCYECMVFSGGINDTLGDMGHECADVTGNATLTGESGTQACLDTIACIINQQCATASPPGECFCGTAVGSSCLNAGAANGPCLQNEVNGLNIGTGTTLGSLVEGDPNATSKAYTNKALGSGMANTLMGFAFSNCQPQCTP
jgi:hypothetical protein